MGAHARLQVRQLQPEVVFDLLHVRAERKLGQVCSEEEYTRVFDRLNALPARAEHLIIQLGDATPSVSIIPDEVECQHRNSDCVPPAEVLGDRIVKAQPFRCIGEVVLWVVYEPI